MNTNAGFIKIPRDVLMLPIWDNPWDAALWFYCALRVSHRKYGHIQAGQFNSSKLQMAQDLHWSRNALKEHLLSLQAKGFVTVQSSYRGVRITLTHWKRMSCSDAIFDDLMDWSEDDDGWSSADHDDEQADDQARDDGHADGQQMTIGGHFVTSGGQDKTIRWSSADHKQEDKQEQDKTLSLMSDREGAFELWWQAYPRHENKADAKLAFMALDVPADRLMAALAVAKTSRQWLSSNGRFIPNAARWLDGTWQDFLPADTSNDREPANKKSSPPSVKIAAERSEERARQKGHLRKTAAVRTK